MGSCSHARAKVLWRRLAELHIGLSDLWRPCSFFTIRDIIKRYHPLALRFFLVGAQYRSPINFTQDALDSVSLFDSHCFLPKSFTCCND